MPHSHSRSLTKSGLHKAPGSKYHRAGLWAIKKKHGGKWPEGKPKKVEPPRTKTVEKVFGKKKPVKRTVTLPRPPRNYTLPTSGRLYNRTVLRRPNIRDSLSSGTVAVMLSGKFKGKRVVVVKRLQSGLVLVTGPYKINGVPLRRVNPAYLIATSSKVSFDKITKDLNKSLVDKTFQKPFVKRADARKAEIEARNKAKEARKARAAAKKSGKKPDEPVRKVKKPISSERIDLQKKVDASILATVKKTPLMKDYLGAKFSLMQGQYPHAMKF